MLVRLGLALIICVVISLDISLDTVTKLDLILLSEGRNTALIH